MGVIIEDIEPYELYKANDYTKAVEQFTNVLSKIVRNYDDLTEAKIRNSVVLKTYFAKLKELATEASIAYSNREFKDLPAKAEKIVNGFQKLYEEITKLTLVAMLAITILQTDLSLVDIIKKKLPYQFYEQLLN